MFEEKRLGRRNHKRQRVIDPADNRCAFLRSRRSARSTALYWLAVGAKILLFDVHSFCFEHVDLDEKKKINQKSIKLHSNMRDHNRVNWIKWLNYIQIGFFFCYVILMSIHKYRRELWEIRLYKACFPVSRMRIIKNTQCLGSRAYKTSQWRNSRRCRKLVLFPKRS